MVDVADIVEQIEKKLSISFERKDYIWIVVEGIIPKHSCADYEKLRLFALLGDSIVDCIVREKIITQQFITGKEKHNWFTYAVSNEFFAELLIDLDIISCINFHYVKPISKKLRHDLGTFFEGIVAVLYLDQGFEAVKEFLDIVLFSNISRYGEKILNVDPVHFLRKICVQHFGKQPRYFINRKPTPEDSRFSIVVSFANKINIEGVDKTYSLARRQAALNALDFLPEQMVVRNK